jgi:predicted AAA+ superfamily ATPase
LELSGLISRKSIFLLGPRQTGKSTFLKTTFPQAKYVDLLAADTFRELSRFPESLRQSLQPHETLVIIDEIQKLPTLLDEVQLLIDRNKDLRFILTGSSARKLRRGRANLLGGRAVFTHFHPLVCPELGFARSIDRMNWGSLPAVIDSPNPRIDLDAYVGTYLREEISAEGLTRSIENFSRVLHIASSCNTQQVNYTKVGNDAQVSPRTVRDYFDILQDTLVARLLPPLQGKRRKAVATEKFYFFDLGVARNLARIGLIETGTVPFGDALEHMVLLELLACSDYRMLNWQINYWRSQSQLEVDFVINGEVAIKVKGSARVSSQDLKGLRALADELPLRRRIVVCNEAHPRILDGIELMPYGNFFRALWQGEILNF